MHMSAHKLVQYHQSQWVPSMAWNLQSSYICPTNTYQNIAKLLTHLWSKRKKIQYVYIYIFYLWCFKLHSTGKISTRSQLNQWVNLCRESDEWFQHLEHCTDISPLPTNWALQVADNIYVKIYILWHCINKYLRMRVYFMHMWRRGQSDTWPSAK